MFFLRPRFVITLAVVSGLLAAYGVYYYLKQQETRTVDTAVPTFVSQKVVVAVADLSIGSTLKSDDLQVRLWPENLVPDGSFGSVEDLVDRVVKTDLVGGEPILESKLAPAGSTGGVSSLIPPGKRAVTVAVNVVSGVGGFILPGTKVDVLVTVSLSGKSDERSTRTILQNVEVLAVDQTYRKEKDDPMEVKSVTLIVSPEEAEKLALAANEGALQLALRGSSDQEPYESSGVALSELMKGPRKPAPRRTVSRPRVVRKPDPTTKVVEVIRANVRSEVELEDNGENPEDGSGKKK
jgi:pilus assembly protein CpaB